ncbi:hypothetical protein SFRURICE_002295 [Spodoptera frugiperda]|nr:hypothetical protein SFRURICE_002295 [Spodoptera frugiperda]
MIFPTTNTCPNTLPYPYDVHSCAEYAFYFFTQHTIELLWGNGWIPWFPFYGTGVQLHGKRGVQNLSLVDFYMIFTCLYRRNWPCIVILLRNIFEDIYEIKRIFSPRVNVIGIRKCVRACIRQKGQKKGLRKAWSDVLWPEPLMRGDVIGFGSAGERWSLRFDLSAPFQFN